MPLTVLVGKQGRAHEALYEGPVSDIPLPGFLSLGSDHLQGYLILGGYTFLNERCSSLMAPCA
jgi:hypothetical protein